MVFWPEASILGLYITVSSTQCRMALSFRCVFLSYFLGLGEQMWAVPKPLRQQHPGIRLHLAQVGVSPLKSRQDTEMRDELGCKRRQPSLRSSTVNHLASPGIWTNIRIGHKGMYKDHCIIYCSKVLYHSLLSIWLNSWQSKDIEWALRGYALKIYLWGVANHFLLSTLWGIVSC